MPVTSRNLTVGYVSGAGKKAPSNLKWDVAKQTLINPSCDCRTVVQQCIGMFPIPTQPSYGNAVCDGSTCYSSLIPSINGLEIKAIPNTVYTLSNYSGSIVFVVNCGTTIVNCDAAYAGVSTTLFSISAGSAFAFGILFGGVDVTFTFT